MVGLYTGEGGAPVERYVLALREEGAPADEWEEVTRSRGTDSGAAPVGQARRGPPLLGHKAHTAARRGLPSFSHLLVSLAKMNARHSVD